MMTRLQWRFVATATVALVIALAFAGYVSVVVRGDTQERGGERGSGAARGGTQRGGEQHADQGVGNGHIPAHGPTRGGQPNRGEANHPPNREGGRPPDEARPSYRDQEGHPEAPHVHAENDRWVGHVGHDQHYHVDHPWEHGHFPGTIGARHVWRLHGGRPDRFEIGGFFFSVAPYDVGFCNDWLWDSDDIVLYDDPDDAGWYLAYNVRLGTYCHVMYMGQ
jgi:hypothetical protein